MADSAKQLDLGPTGHTVRRNITRLRKAQDLTYAELSRRLTDLGRAIPALGLRRIEGAQRRVDADELVALAIALRTVPNMLLFPPVRADHLRTAVTGVGEVTTSEAWVWADGGGRWGLAPEHTPFPWNTGTMRPLDVLSKDERIARRRRWVAATLEDLERELRGVLEEGETYEVEGGRLIGVDQPVTDDWIAEHRQDIEELKALDPADDRAWAPRPNDPGREWEVDADLRPELLEGLTVDD